MKREIACEHTVQLDLHIFVNKVVLQLCKYLLMPLLLCVLHAIHFPFMGSELETNISIYMPICRLQSDIFERLFYSNFLF
jgi:hypothetical protein